MNPNFIFFKVVKKKDLLWRTWERKKKKKHQKIFNFFFILNTTNIYINLIKIYYKNIFINDYKITLYNFIIFFIYKKKRINSFFFSFKN